MMKNIKIWMTGIVLFSMALTSCIDDGKDDVAGKGTNEFRFSGDDFAVVTFKPFLAGQQSQLITIYRDAVSTGAMDKEVTISFEVNSDSLTAYNTAHSTTFLETDPAWYTLNIPEGTLTFAPNEGAKTIHITIDTNPFNLSAKYAIPLVIKNASDNYETNENHNLIIVQTLPINKYDGVYEATGTMVDAANANLQHINVYRSSPGALVTGNQQFALVTTGAQQCAVFDYDFFGDYFAPISDVGAGSYSRYGNWSAIFNFDNDDVITAVTNYWGQPNASNGRYGTVDPTATNQWSAGGIEGVGYRMHQPSVMGGAYNAGTPDGACTGCYGSAPRTVWAETWEYLEPR